eukprot:6177454-Pleurochrysis_carterae.AAC.3
MVAAAVRACGYGCMRAFLPASRSWQLPQRTCLRCSCDACRRWARRERAAVRDAPSSRRHPVPLHIQYTIYVGFLFSKKRAF